MNTDDGGGAPQRSRVDFKVPRLIDVRVKAIRHEPPRHHHFESALPAGEAIEFRVTTDEPFEARALGPALFVGDVALVEVTELAPTEYRFLALDPTALQSGAPLSLGWTGDRPPENRRVKFVYQPPEPRPKGRWGA